LRRHADCEPDRSARGAPEAPARAGPDVCREPDDVRARPAPRGCRHGRGARRRPRGGGIRVDVFRVRARDREDSRVSDEERRRIHGDWKMSFIAGKHIPRRTVLRGLGATVALPFLDAMVPARGLFSNAARAASLDRTRLVCIEMVHGAAGASEWGAKQHLWSPAAAGRDFDLSQGALASLEPFRKYLTIVSDTDVRNAEAVTQPEIGGDHFRSSAVFLTQTHPKQTESSDVRAGISLDQIYANRFGHDTPIPSMQLRIENVDQAAGWRSVLRSAYPDVITWASPTEPLPMIRDPRMAFDQLLGAGGSAKERASRRKATASVLDSVTGQVADLNRRLDPSDRQRM